MVQPGKHLERSVTSTVIVPQQRWFLVAREGKHEYPRGRVCGVAVVPRIPDVGTGPGFPIKVIFVHGELSIWFC